jgi:hypothetical protein
MHSKDPRTPPDPSIVPEAVTVHNGNTAPRGPDKPTTLVGKLLAVLRGDKYMMNAYPPQWREPAATSPAATETGVSKLATEADGLKH